MFKVIAKLGPGLLYAAAAIGVSHLVQSTRAGAQFGFELVWVVILANIIKYPFFKIGPLYTSLTGKSLLTGYKKIAPWVIPLFMIITLATMFIVQSAVTVVTAGLLLNLTGLDFNIAFVAIAILIICSAILILGRYNILDNLIKVIVIVLTFTTLISVVFSLSFNPVISGNILEFNISDQTHIFFIIALIGWMPAPMDIPIWHSLWSVAKNEQQNKITTIKESMIDFKVGYFTTAILAVCFLMLGALIMYPTGQSFSPGATSFASELIGLYTKSLGNWSYSLIAIAALTTMFSTTIACLDAFSRLMRESIYVITEDQNYTHPKHYNLWLVITVLGASLILLFYLTNMKSLVDLATTLSFVVAPIYAYFNFKINNSDEIPKEYKFKGLEKFIAIFGIIFFTLFTIYFLTVKFIL
jgi:Mn2+/Fe2+ NRAMP family transporter